ncbi:MAG: RluA family pseudouridine synthase [Ardenticatenaceae bacterium]
MSPQVRHIRLTVPTEAKKERLDRWLSAQLSALSRSQIGRLLADGQITLDGVVPNKGGVKVMPGQVVEVRLPPEAGDTPQAEPMDLEVLYEDAEVAVINKPPRVVVHPAPGHSGGTLVNGLLARYPELDDPEQPDRPGIVHRLDRDTSGVLIVARTVAARHILQAQFRKRTTEKEYIALVLGHPDTARGTIEGPIGRHRTHRQKRAVVPTGRPAVTHYETLESFAASTLLLVRPVTGRTHQIRVHLDAIGLPVAGDELYGPRRRRIPTLNRHFLHAARLTITTPIGQTRTFEAPLPEELKAVLNQLRASS